MMAEYLFLSLFFSVAPARYVVILYTVNQGSKVFWYNITQFIYSQDWR